MTKGLAAFVGLAPGPRRATTRWAVDTSMGNAAQGGQPRTEPGIVEPGTLPTLTMPETLCQLRGYQP